MIVRRTFPNSLKRLAPGSRPRRTVAAGRSLVLSRVIFANLFALVVAAGAHAQDDTNDIPQIRPLHPPLPSTYWEQHGPWVIVAGAQLVFFLGLIVWQATRPKPVVPVPPAVAAREALMALPAHVAEGAKLSHISQILRDYLRRAFQLPAGELTTTEFCRLLADHPVVGPALAGDLTNFLRDNDRRKFSLQGGTVDSMNAVTVALSLIEKSEARRAKPVPPGQTP